MVAVWLFQAANSFPDDDAGRPDSHPRAPVQYGLPTGIQGGRGNVYVPMEPEAWDRGRGEQPTIGREHRAILQDEVGLFLGIDRWLDHGEGIRQHTAVASAFVVILAPAIPVNAPDRGRRSLSGTVPEFRLSYREMAFKDLDDLLAVFPP